jgi:hypothetical protein
MLAQPQASKQAESQNDRPSRISKSFEEEIKMSISRTLVWHVWCLILPLTFKKGGRTKNCFAAKSLELHTNVMSIKRHRHRNTLVHWQRVHRQQRARRRPWALSSGFFGDWTAARSRPRTNESPKRTDRNLIHCSNHLPLGANRKNPHHDWFLVKFHKYTTSRPRISDPTVTRDLQRVERSST